MNSDAETGILEELSRVKCEMSSEHPNLRSFFNALMDRQNKGLRESPEMYHDIVPYPIRGRTVAEPASKYGVE